MADLTLLGDSVGNGLGDSGLSGRLAVAQLGAVAVWLGLVALAALVGKRWLTSAPHVSPFGTPEIVRKVVHIGTGNVILLAWWFNIPAWIGISFSIFFSGVTLASYWLPILPMINSVGRRSWGTFFYAMSIGLLITAFWPMAMPQYAVIGVLVMTWGDGMAALIGQRWGRHILKIGGSTKSLEGSGTMLVVSFIVAIVVLWISQGLIGATWGVAVAIAVIATILELFSQFGIDNLTVPIGSGAIAFGLNHLWLGL